MSTHNICFRAEIRKIIIWIPPLIWRYVISMNICVCLLHKMACPVKEVI